MGLARREQEKRRNQRFHALSYTGHFQVTYVAHTHWKVRCSSARGANLFPFCSEICGPFRVSTHIIAPGVSKLYENYSEMFWAKGCRRWMAGHFSSMHKEVLSHITCNCFLFCLFFTGSVYAGKTSLKLPIFLPQFLGAGIGNPCQHSQK